MKKRTITRGLLGLIALGMLGCKKNFPSDLDAFSLEMNFSTTEFQPILGRTTSYTSIFNADQSTMPLTFRISDVRNYEGKPAPELLKLFPVSIWKSRYTGEEKSLNEIRAKRDTVMRPLWEIGEHSGNLTMHSASNANILKTYPDSGYYFDVDVSNNGGRRFFKNMRLIPKKEESSDGGFFMSTGVLGDSTKNILIPIQVWYHKTGEGSSISFKVLGPDLKPIKLSRFNETNWDELVHGFNKKMSSDSTVVRYDVEYPMPLVPTIATKWNSGDFAKSQFQYSRIALGGIRLQSRINIFYSIYEKGDWDVVIYFPDEAPLFDND
ncbi:MULTISPECIES: DUF5007 domain-containing protein [unclassified Sphingobacterium]|uniref:DUF5007 domain-containing protein n=1 Tax=unclassified Sphingobacterium TaxID=2609468 RepID=UPI00104B1C8D|nr:MULTISPECIES: DUF5007 domain-containing protein [unclassified Sphingobacterium]MBB2954277.1 hypothetical protein [Sphingobacterium sp. JUb56]MCS3555751.1 hypothetical protein [Sphingobacterium sp. JUb21]TCR00796.1 uncharacterized protein DUF5007 [Sphingobacterium sp. JUb20]